MLKRVPPEILPDERGYPKAVKGVFYLEMKEVGGKITVSISHSIAAAGSIVTARCR